MKHTATLLFIFSLFIGIQSPLLAQKEYKIHSHNDYQQEFPFWNAYINGAASIEVDIFLRDNQLFVTHEEREIKVKNTLERLYLDQLKSLGQSGELRKLMLLIDIKSEAYTTLEKLTTVLKQYPGLYSNEKLRFVISGNRPKPTDYSNYPKFIEFDHQNLNDLDDIPLEKVAMISRNFKHYTIWNGYGRLTGPDLSAVKEVIKKAHNARKPFRFWATPDTKTSWTRLANLGVDYINTDHPEKLRPFLELLDENVLKKESPIKIYEPNYAYDQNATPKNVIIMVGDGSGLAQISATQIANQGKLTLTGLRDIGLVKTASYDDLVTDSAAGGTAIATGNKTDNRSIGVGPEGDHLESIFEKVSGQGYYTGIISTDPIYGATPASFYAHQVERDNTEGILEDLNNSDLNFFIAGGRSKESSISRRFITKDLETFDGLEQPTAIYFGGDKSSLVDKEQKTLHHSVNKALEVLKDTDRPFFLLVEGALIDSGGHANNIRQIVDESLDFDLAIAEVLRFADSSANTLVVITSDHETSGLGIIGGEEKKGIIQADFLTVDHTGIMVPLFAYGPGADNFRGVYENTEIYTRILEVLKQRTE